MTPLGRPSRRRGRAVRLELASALAIGIVLGVLHFTMGVRALAVFRKDEPISLLVVLCLGPLSTLPAALLAVFSRRLSAVWLIAGGLFSLIGLMVYAMGQGEPAENMGSMIVVHLITTALPMILLGTGFLWLERYLARTP